MATLILYSSLSQGVSGRVYFGDPKTLEQQVNPKVATVRAKEVYERIASYRKISEEGVEKGSARYQQLMLKATNTFKVVVQAEANGKYHVVAEEGKVSGYKVYDITQSVIQRLP